MKHHGMLLLLITACCALGRTFYVDAVDGNDGADGRSDAAAWKTLTKVNGTTFSAGDTVLFKGGRKWTGVLLPKGSGTSGTPIVFGACGAGRPHINAGGATEAVMLKDVEHFVFEGFKVTNTAATTERRARGIVIYADAQRAFDGITVRDNELTDIIGDSRQATRYLNGSIFTDSRGSGRFTNLLIENNHIHDVTVRGITGNQAATNWENPETMHRYVTVRSNRIDNIGADGIRMIACRDLLVEHNTVYRCGANNRGMELSYIAACFPQQCVNTVWQYNEVAYTAHTNPAAGDEDSEAFDVDWGCGGTHIFQYNYTHDNVGGFFLFMGKIVSEHETKVGPYVETILRYNVSINDGIRTPIARIYEIHPYDGKVLPVIAYNNTFINKQEIGIHLKNAADYNGIAFYNNVFIAPKGAYPGQMLVYDNNLYHGHNALSADGHAVIGDPLVAMVMEAGEGMPRAHDAMPGMGSAVIGAGKTIDDNGGRDFAGTALPAADPPDIGAFQFAGTAVCLRPSAGAYSALRGAPFVPGMPLDIMGRCLSPGSTACGVRVFQSEGVQLSVGKGRAWGW